MALRRHHRDDGTFQGPIISGAPFRGATFDEAAIGDAAIGDAAIGDASHAADDADVGDGDDEHRNDEHLVTLTSVPTRFGADVVVAELESCGIKAGVVGRRVMVFERDLATARAIIAETDGDQTAADEQPETYDRQAADGQPDFGRQ